MKLNYATILLASTILFISFPAVAVDQSSFLQNGVSSKQISALLSSLPFKETVNAIRPYIEPKSKLASIGFSIVRAESSSRLIDLRAGISHNIRSPRAGVQLTVNWD